MKIEKSKKNIDDITKSRESYIGINILSERKVRKFTRKQLADMTGLSESYLGLLERSERSPSIKCLLSFCDLYNVTPNELMLPREQTAKPSNKYNAALSLLHTLDDKELAYIVNCMASLKKLANNKM